MHMFVLFQRIAMHIKQCEMSLYFTKAGRNIILSCLDMDETFEFVEYQNQYVSMILDCYLFTVLQHS